VTRNGTAASREDRANETWVHLEGELDHEGCDQVAPALLSADGLQTVVVDMTGVTFVSSVGIGLLLRAHRELRAQGRSLLLHGLRPHIRKSLELVGALRIIPEWEGA
jgi:anti-sigma B factor antagonist